MMKDSCYFSAFEDETDAELSLDELRNLKILQNPIFDEPIYCQYSLRQEKQLNQIFNRSIQEHITGLLSCNEMVKMLLSRSIIKDANSVNMRKGCLNRTNSQKNLYSESHCVLRQRDVEDAFNQVRRKHERKISYEAFKKILGILAIKLYPECGKAQGLELLKARIIQPKVSAQKVSF